MLQQQPPFVGVFPSEQEKILFENSLNVGFAEAPADGSTMFVIDHAGGLVEVHPSALPGLVAEVRVFEIERREKVVEASQLEKLAAIIRAGAAAAGGKGITLPNGLIDAVANTEAAALPPAFGETRLLPDLGGIGEIDLTGDREHSFVVEAVEQRLQEVRLHA